MSRIKIIGNSSGTGDFTLTSPNSDTSRTLTLPDHAGTILASATIVVDETNGKLGIGTSSPSSYNSAMNNLVAYGSGDSGITIASGTASEGSLAFADGTTGNEAYRGWINYNHGSDFMRIFTAGSERMRINSSGDVGISTTSPSTNLHVRGDGSGDFSPYNDVLRVQGDSYTVLHLKATNNQASMIYDRNGTTGWYSGLDNNGNYKMSYMSAMNGTGLGNAKDTGTPAIYIDNQNSVYVGTAGNYPQNGSTGIKLEYTGRIVLSRSQETTLQQTRYGNDGTVSTYFRDANSVGSISVNNSSTSFNTNSDYRLKENVVEVTDGINRVKLLKPSRFNFISDPDKTVDGFLAHEVQDVVPEAIFGTKDAVDSDGNPEYQGIDQSKLVPLLTAALQEAITEIESLKSRLDAAGL